MWNRGLWGAAIKAATKEQIERRKMDAVEMTEADESPARIPIGNDDEIYHMDANGRFRGEFSNKKLDSNGVKSARSEEIRQFHCHGVC